ncbi:BACON domain-containing protein, partial [Streptomyces sp. IBSBF 2435]|uniref:BACON domain-containing protein n=1 Tax=Streptomyces sp. IBSBF 2435 TaxID=2903531 RepID=UPI003FA79C8E
MTAAPGAGRTLVTLTAGGSGEVRWTASTAAGWLRLSAVRGVLRTGESVTVAVTVVPELAPDGSWSASIAFAPGGGAAVLRGTTRRASPPPVSPPPAP